MQKTNVWLATTLINCRVRNNAGESLGRIEDVVIDPADGNTQYAVISLDGGEGAGRRFFAVPWSALSISPNRDYVLLNTDRATLDRAPRFDPDHWPDMSDPAWRRSIHDYYGVTAPVPAVRERTVYVDRVVPAKRGMSLFAGIALICLVLGLAWITFLVSTRGWDQAGQDMKSSLQSAAYAAKETSRDAALTTKVKAAFALSKRIPSDKVSVDSVGDVVTLRGEVPSDQIRDLAGAIAGDVPGVGEVHNHIYALNRTQ